MISLTDKTKVYGALVVGSTPASSLRTVNSMVE